MVITFKNKKISALVNNDRKLLKEMGKKRADKIRQRLDQLQAAETLEDLRHVAGNYHELTGDRKGQWACDLDQPYRLIFIPHENPVPVNTSGQYIWLEIRGVEIIEITDYH
ncbi:MAG TPA: type II toxin-antitoxin system RelE/ParE family toxin [bacterium]|nr:type II toxin-antitoxin system RelE/ParE family toxin [bacterium]HMW32295.1 type II toxin-antitoxin system RelE/ParE family toxin [bacterium]HMW35643.1 type II toxin-antitoxin system RelE/ParE family toxin [bacterium]HMY34630.1 type II toxin-antitoxin system RelE/ParE family toxin [bacterium]HMZ03819.1 type II toxin-antitoxin system RelE/ParE family toxin [bacterium]